MKATEQKFIAILADPPQNPIEQPLVAISRKTYGTRFWNRGFDGLACS